MPRRSLIDGEKVGGFHPKKTIASMPPTTSNTTNARQPKSLLSLKTSKQTPRAQSATQPTNRKAARAIILTPFHYAGDARSSQLVVNVFIFVECSPIEIGVWPTFIVHPTRQF
jgi:hypothetical protein